MKKLITMLYGASALISVNASTIQQAYGQEIGVGFWNGFYAGVIGGYGQGEFTGSATAVGDNSPYASTTTASVSSYYTTYLPGDTLVTTVCGATLTSMMCSYWVPSTQTFSVTTSVLVTTTIVADTPENYVYDEEDFALTDESFLAGFRAGADANLGGLVVGVVADAALADFFVNHDFIGDSGASISFNQTSVMTLRARLGVALSNVLLYGTAGIAGGNVTAALTTDFGGSPNTYTQSQFMTGFTAGVGASVVLTPNMFVDFTYLHSDLGTANFTFNNGVGEVGTASVGVTNDIFTVGMMFKMP